MRLKNRNLAVIIFCSFVLTGCASLPIQTATTYFKELYKRIPYTTEGRYRVINIFYATNRNIKNTGDLTPSFGNELSSQTTCGRMDVKIDPRIKIEKMLPGRLKRRGVVGVQEVQKLESDIFMKQLNEAVQASPHNSLLVVIFGYKDNFEATAIKASYFAYLLDVNTPILLYDWPGDQPVTPWGYEKAQKLARESGPYLGELLTKIIRQMAPKKLWIKASSLGCQVVCDAFDRMCTYPDLADPDTEIDHVILAAPDVGQKEFDTRFKDELLALSKSLTVYVSSNDDALLMSGLINQEHKLGRQKVSENDQLDETKDILYLKSLAPDRITLIDVTPINRSSYKHGYYLESPEFYNDFYLRIFDKKPNVNRCLYLVKFKKDTDYWIMQNSNK